MSNIQTLTKTVPLGKDSGKTFAIPLHEVIRAETVAAIVADEMAMNIFLIGVGRIFTDCQASAKTDAERLAACEKKLDAWRSGEFNVRGGGGETIEGEVKRLLLDAYMKASGQSSTKAEAALKGKGFEVLRTIANAKAAATEGNADELFEAAKADWIARATASLEAKAKAREGASKVDLTSLI